MACHLYNTERCLQLQLFKRPNFGVHFSTCHHWPQTVCILQIQIVLYQPTAFVYCHPIVAACHLAQVGGEVRCKGF